MCRPPLLHLIPKDVSYNDLKVCKGLAELIWQGGVGLGKGVVLRP